MVYGPLLLTAPLFLLAKANKRGGGALGGRDRNPGKRLRIPLFYWQKPIKEGGR